mgnify:CR=1 FL=1
MYLKDVMYQQALQEGGTDSGAPCCRFAVICSGACRTFKAVSCRHALREGGGDDSGGCAVRPRRCTARQGWVGGQASA